MTPKEKAKELIHIYQSILIDEIGSKSAREFIVKQCALIAVDEIIQSRIEDGSFNDKLSAISSEYYTPHPMYLIYWEEVKQEIEKL